jgi:hypothetical protein
MAHRFAAFVERPANLAASSQRRRLAADTYARDLDRYI